LFYYGIFYILNYETVFFMLYCGVLNDVAEVAIVPTDILNFESLFLLNKEADVLFFAVTGF